jgi:hypothetical protein
MHAVYPGEHGVPVFRCISFPLPLYPYTPIIVLMYCPCLSLPLSLSLTPTLTPTLTLTLILLLLPPLHTYTPKPLHPCTPPTSTPPPLPAAQRDRHAGTDGRRAHGGGGRGAQGHLGGAEAQSHTGTSQHIYIYIYSIHTKYINIIDIILICIRVTQGSSQPLQYCLTVFLPFPPLLPNRESCCCPPGL